MHHIDDTASTNDMQIARMHRPGFTLRLHVTAAPLLHPPEYHLPNIQRLRLCAFDTR